MELQKHKQMENKGLTFEIMVTDANLLKIEIDRYNNCHNTDFSNSTNYRGNRSFFLHYKDKIRIIPHF